MKNNQPTISKMPVLSDYLEMGSLITIETILDFILTDDPNIKHYKADSKVIKKAIALYRADLQKHISKPVSTETA